LKYAIRIFKGAKGVAMPTKFRQKYTKILHFELCARNGDIFCTYDRVFGNGEVKYAIRIFQVANGVAKLAMSTKFRQNKPKLE